VQQQQAQLDHRAVHLQKLMEQAPEPLRNELVEKMELSWIYHESALEGVVYSPDELLLALRGGTPTDPVMVSSFDEIRQSKATIDLIRSWAAEKRSKVDADVIKDIYASLAPDEVDGKKPPAYRKDIPLHRLYFHEIAAPDKIAPKLKAFGQWINATDTRRTTHVLRLAAKAHFHLLHIYPYPKHSGKVARLVMNLLLMSAGYPPAVIHSTERQRYYDALKTNENALAQIVKEALTASIESGIRFLEGRLPPPAPPPVKKPRATPRKAVKADAPASPAPAKPAVASASRPSSPVSAAPVAKAAVKPSRPQTTQLPTKPKVAKAQASKPAPAPAKPAPAKLASAKPTPAKPAATKAAPAKPTPAKPTPAKPAPAKPAPAKPAPAKPAPAKPLAAKVAKTAKSAARPAKTATKTKSAKPKARRAA
jgi:hypothetical protein